MPNETSESKTTLRECVLALQLGIKIRQEDAKRLIEGGYAEEKKFLCVTDRGRELANEE